jgi:hypothetical protein
MLKQVEIWLGVGRRKYDVRNFGLLTSDFSTYYILKRLTIKI